MTSWVNSEGPAGTADERMGWCDHSAAFILRRHGGRQICNWVSSSAHFHPITISVLKETPPFLPFYPVCLFAKCSLVYFPQTSFCPKCCDGTGDPDLCGWKSECSFMMRFPSVAETETVETGDTDTREKWSGRKWPPNVRGIPKGWISLPLSHSCTAITLESVTMISTSRYAWGQTWFWLCAGNVRKAHTGKLCSRLSLRFG